MKKIFFIFLVLFFFCKIIFAEPSLLSTTGMVSIPTGDTITVKGFNFSAFRLEGEKINNQKIKTHIYCINYGVIENMEIGGGTIERDDPDTTGITLLQTKYKIVKETTTNPALSIGGIYASRKKDNPDKEQVTIYAAVSQNLSWPSKVAKKFGIRATIGVGSELLDGIFGGVELKIGDQTKMMCEYDTEDYNFSLRQNLTPAIMAQILKRSDDYGLGIIVQIR